MHGRAHVAIILRMLLRTLFCWVSSSLCRLLRHPWSTGKVIKHIWEAQITRYRKFLEEIFLFKKKSAKKSMKHLTIQQCASTLSTFKLYQRKKQKGGKIAWMHNVILLPWGSLAAMEFSDPETNPSPNQLAVIHMHILELLITESNSTSTQGGVSSLKMKQTERSRNVL